MSLRFLLATVFLIAAHISQGQVPHNPTSATDADVKIHNGRRVKRELRATERHGESYQKRKPSRDKRVTAREARVFRKHSGEPAAKASKTNRSRSRKKKN